MLEKGKVYTVLHYLHNLHHSELDTGWIDVVELKEKKIPADLQTQQLQIKTVSVAGSYDRISLYFYAGDSRTAGGMSIWLSAPIKYWISYCNSKYSPFPIIPPETQENIWGILRTDRGITIECNGVVVLEIDVSRSTCEHEYYDVWTSSVKMIEFSSDTASRKYRLVNQGEYT